MSRRILVRAVLFGMLVGVALPATAGGSRLRAAVNDDFDARLVLAADAGQVAGDNIGASSETGEPRHAGSTRGGRSVWWSWTPSADGLATLHTFRSDFDTLLAVYTGDAVDALSPVASNDDVRELFVDQSRTSFPVTGGVEYQIAVDGYNDSGRILLTWFLDSTPEQPPENDAFAERRTLEGAEGQAFASSQSATKEEGEPNHVRAGGRSLWWRWVAPSDGFVTFDTHGSSFDTLLAVYSGSQLTDLATLGSSDNAGAATTTSSLNLQVEHRREYQIAVDGINGTGGVVALNWRLSTICRNPSAPDEPRPTSAGVDVDRFNVRLSWNNSPPIVAEQIYGADDREDIFEVRDPAILRLWEATAILTPPGNLRNNGDGSYSLNARTFGDDLGLCLDEPFRNQPAAPGSCSGFLVGPDLMVTAGHCVATVDDCANFVVVFGYRMLNPTTVVTTFDQADVYFCREVIEWEFNQDLTGGDWSLFRLDRAVRDRRPLEIRRTGRVANLQSVFVIGHPWGLPAKFADGATVRENTDPDWFGANLDHLSGNSGSPVFNRDTLAVEGVLVRGPLGEFVDNGACVETRVCRDDAVDCIYFAESTRTTVFQHLVPPLPPIIDPEPEDVVFEVHFGRAGEELALLGETEEPLWTFSQPLEPGTEYAWQVVAKVDCGFSVSPLWTFRTAGDSNEVLFRRGDVGDDGRLNLTDAVSVLQHLFRGGPEPSCLKSVDADDDGIVGLTDPVYILNHLFRSGPPPDAPFESCGPDPTGDTLTCRSFEPCAQ